MNRILGLALAALLLGGVACRQTAQTSKKIPITTSSAEARDAFLKARDLAENLRTAQTRPLLDEAIRKDPNFAMAHLLRAQSASSTSEYFESLKAATAAAGAASDGEQLLIRAEESTAANDSKAAGGYLAKLVAAYPEDERAHTSLGVYRYLLKDYDGAISEFQKATELSPAYAPAYNMLGYSFKEAHKSKEAESALRKYVELTPNDPNPYDSLAEFLMSTGQFSDSIGSYRKALSLDAAFSSAYRGIAANLMYQEKHKEALDQLEEGLNRVSDDAARRTLLRSMAVTYLDQGQVEPAIAMLGKESALAEQRGEKAAMATAANARGYVLLYAGKIDQAGKEFSNALDLSRQASMPEGGRKGFELASHRLLALAAATRKDFPAAAKEAEAARSGAESLADPTMMRLVHGVVGEIALRQAKYDDAISQLNQADAGSPYTMFQLAKAYAGKKDAANARKYYEMAANARILPDLDYAMVRKAALKALK